MKARHFSLPIAVLALLHSAIAVRPTAMEQARAVTPMRAESGESRAESRKAESGESRVEGQIGPSLRLALDSRLWSLDSVHTSRPSPAVAIYAVVRVPSHGASATVIATRAGKSLLLGCAHAFEGPARQSPIRLDVPARSHQARPWAKCRLVDIDYQADLSLVELDDGPSTLR